MSIIVEVVPDPIGPHAEGSVAVSTPETDLAWKLQSAYQQRFALYERQLAEALSLLGSLSPELVPSYFPQVSVVFGGDEGSEGEVEEVVFDFTLYESLLQIYIFEGWKGISQVDRLFCEHAGGADRVGRGAEFSRVGEASEGGVEQALDMRLPPADVDAPSGGVRATEATLWLPVRAFFRFTRNLIAMLIQNALAEIERKAAAEITARLKHSAAQVEKAWDSEFQVKEIRHFETFSAEYLVGNRELSNKLFEGLSEVVKSKVAYDESLRKLDESLRKLEQDKFYRDQGILPTPYPGGQGDLDTERQIAEQSKKLLAFLKEVIYQIHWVGVTVIDGLSIGFEQEVMDRKLIAVLWEFRNKIHTILGEVGLSSSRALTICNAPAITDITALTVLQDWVPPAAGIENFVASTAVEQLADDPGWFPLAHEVTLHRLVESGAIAKDSFEYVVYAHYASALIDLVEARRQGEEAHEEFWKTFGRIAAAISLASLATPATAEFAPLLRGVSTVADLVVIAHSIYSVTENLARLSQLVAEELAHPDAFALERLARAGELIQIRGELLDQMAVQLAVEIAAMAVGAIWPLVKKLWLARGYYYDLETLLDDGQED